MQSFEMAYLESKLQIVSTCESPKSSLQIIAQITHVFWRLSGIALMQLSFPIHIRFPYLDSKIELQSSWFRARMIDRCTITLGIEVWKISRISCFGNVPGCGHKLALNGLKLATKKQASCHTIKSPMYHQKIRMCKIFTRKTTRSIVSFPTAVASVLFRLSLQPSVRCEI